VKTQAKKRSGASFRRAGTIRSRATISQAACSLPRLFLRAELMTYFAKCCAQFAQIVARILPARRNDAPLRFFA